MADLTYQRKRPKQFTVYNARQSWENSSHSSVFVTNLTACTEPHSIAVTFKNKLRKDQAFDFGSLNETGIDILENLQHQRLLPPILSLPRSNGRYMVDTDARDKQVLCILWQDQPKGTTKPKGYWSGSTSRAAKAYYKAETKCLAVVWTSYYLGHISKFFTIETHTTHRSDGYWIWRRRQQNWQDGAYRSQNLIL